MNASSDGKGLPGRLPRLPREYYQGDAYVHWTLSVFDRVTGWLTDGFHAHFRELMLHTAAREGLFCPAYCLMPDHIHLVWMGLWLNSDQLRGMVFLRTYLQSALAPAKFQPQAHDNVLRQVEREHDAFAKVCFYILNNPMEAKLVVKPGAWNFSGAVLPGYPTLHPLGNNYWDKFWKLYLAARHSDAGNIKRPWF
jgi:hypothetical protein